MDALMDIDQIPIGSILEIDFNLIAHPNIWIKHRRSILLKKSERSIKVYDTVNEHVVVLTRRVEIKVKVINGLEEL